MGKSMRTASELFFFFNVYLFLRGGEGQGGKETQIPKQAPGSELSAQSRTRGSNSGTAESQPELKSDA